MGIYILNVDLGPGDHRPVRSIYSEFVKEARKGRRPEQISLNGSLIIVQTPETSRALMTRMLSVNRLDPAFDRVSLVDVAVKRMLFWGLSDEGAADKFPLLIEQFVP